ncbi:DUF1599 domain-containing protein [Candidatus Woesearchaeota archaeon]|nr:DUF1599 domain-containing protein [Candidatus Woesearchaeota archaeon]
MNFKEMQKILDETRILLEKKNEMYGDGNIDQMGEEGIMFRLNDKIIRLKNLLEKNINPPEETIEDTWKDIIGYGIIGLMVRRKKWK